MLAGGKRSSPTEPKVRQVGFAKQKSDEVEYIKIIIFGCNCNLHLISHFVTASPQGEAFDKLSTFFVTLLLQSPNYRFNKLAKIKKIKSCHIAFFLHKKYAYFTFNGYIFKFSTFNFFMMH